VCCPMRSSRCRVPFRLCQVPVDAKCWLNLYRTTNRRQFIIGSGQARCQMSYAGSLPRWCAFFSHMSSKVCGKFSYIMPASSFLDMKGIDSLKSRIVIPFSPLFGHIKCTTTSSCKIVQECILEVCAYPFSFQPTSFRILCGCFSSK